MTTKNVCLNESQAQKMREALTKVQQLVSKRNGLSIIFNSYEYYFVERTLIELGYLKPNKNGCAHTTFLNLMDELGVPFRRHRPTLDQLGAASRDITEDRYPWQPAGEGKTYEANVFDVKRWRAIYHWLHKYLQE